jgi:small GTP-binding protein
MKIINIGILAHVDAGKTTLTESLLYASGAISEPGSVEKGTTRTDTMFLERQRGITIQAAVTSFQWHRCKVNIVDTPGHMDFLAEVYRSLAVLDGAILVISAKDGVQAQTRILFHALTLTYTNKDKTLPKLTIYLQKVASENEDDAPAYQIVQVGDMNAMGYEEQSAVKEWLLDCYAATRVDDMAVAVN